MKALFLTVQLVLAVLMMWSCFCRLTKTDRDTHREVRWSFVFEGLCAGLVAGAPFLPALMPGQINWKTGTTPGWVWTMLLLSVWLVQVVTARYWREGCPTPFRKTMTRMPRRGLLPAMAATGLTVMVALLAAAPQALAQAQDKWREVEGDHVYLPPGAEVRCTNEKGCVAITIDGLRALLKQAGGTCGRIPKVEPGETPITKPGRHDI